MSTDNTSDPHPGTPEIVTIERREALIKLGKYAAYATPVVTDEEVLTPTVSDEALEGAASNQRQTGDTNNWCNSTSGGCCFFVPTPAVSRDR
jgi:hypothetical protein